MAAVYPGQFRPWVERLDYTHVVFAEHFNTAQDELMALLRTVGLTPQIAKNDPGTTPFSLLPIVDWLANAPAAELDTILDFIDGFGRKKHHELMDEIQVLWPDWLGELL